MSKILATGSGKDPKSASSTTRAVRAPYAKFNPKQKATVGNYAVSNGTSAALRCFKTKFPKLKWSTVNDWKNTIIKHKRVAGINRDEEPIDVVELVGKKRGRPSTLPEDITRELTEYIRTIRDNGGIVNIAIVIAAGLAERSYSTRM